MPETIANRVAQMRQELGHTQEEMAHAVGVTRQTIIAIERGNYAPSVLLALRIAHYFGKSVETVFYIIHEK